MGETNMFLQFMIMCLFPLPFITALGTLRGSNSSGMNNIAKPGCPAKCGDVTVPYPFGMGKNINCSLNDMFYLTCNASSDSDKTPQLFIRSGSNLRIHSISESEVRIFNNVSYKCYHQDGNVSDGSNWDLNFKGHFTFSVKNMFTVIGCADYGLITGKEEDDFSSGCIGWCNKASDVPDGQCTGQGCCQTPISKGLNYFDVTLGTFGNHTVNKCGYAFLCEVDSFKFHGIRDLSNTSTSEFLQRIQSTVPVVLDWVIANRTCAGATECKENSECYNVEGGGYNVEGGGYRCRCNKGYQGNAYLEPGCQDINECKDPRIYPCHGNCINTPGSYKCTCPLGYVGYATLPGGCERQVIVRSKKFLIIFILLGVFLGTGILVLAIWMSKVVRKRKDKKCREKFFKRNGGLLLQQQTSNGEDAIETTRMFSARELEKATDQYNNNRILGRGGQGTVYKGMLPNGKIVAVKKSVLMDETQVESFINEVFLLSQISHRNVVKLLGCCLETEVPVLVYEFVSNGSLFQFIHDENYEFPTLWSIRITIATEVAGALAYMHSATSIPIYHRDIKSSNILLDEKFRAKLSDFGISKSVMGDQTHLSTVVKGTYGYLDPEYFQSNQFTEKSDVYSFGIVLVELLTGKKAIYSTSPGESRSLATLILSMEEGLILENIDDRVLDGPKAQLIAVAKLAKRCLNLNGKQRPTMKDVATELEGIRSSSP